MRLAVAGDVDGIVFERVWSVAAAAVAAVVFAAVVCSAGG